MDNLNKIVSSVLYNSDKHLYEIYSDSGRIIASIDEIFFEKLMQEFIHAKYNKDNIVMPIIIKEELSNTELSTEEEAEELRTRAMARIAKLRNLSFGGNSNDAKNEFDQIPAYLRRNMDLPLSQKEIELYGNYDLKFEADPAAANVVMSNIEQEKNHSEQVFIFLPQEEILLLDTERLTNACGDFMEALEYELEVENEPIFGSFLQKLMFKIKEGKKITQAEIQTDFAKGKRALELKYVELPTAEQTEKLANSAAKIVELLDKQDEGVVRLGAIIVLKKIIDGKSKIIIQQLSFDLISILDKRPQLLQNLQTTYELLTGDVKGINSGDETIIVSPQLPPSTAHLTNEE